jgi:hypothetical protein
METPQAGTNQSTLNAVASKKGLDSRCDSIGASATLRTARKGSGYFLVVMAGDEWTFSR